MHEEPSLIAADVLILDERRPVDQRHRLSILISGSQLEENAPDLLSRLFSLQGSRGQLPRSVPGPDPFPLGFKANASRRCVPELPPPPPNTHTPAHALESAPSKHYQHRRYAKEKTQFSLTSTPPTPFPNQVYCFPRVPGSETTGCISVSIQTRVEGVGVKRPPQRSRQNSRLSPHRFALVPSVLLRRLLSCCRNVAGQVAGIAQVCRIHSVSYKLT